MYKVVMIKRFLVLIFGLIFFALRCFPQNSSNDNKLRDLVSKYGQVQVTIPLTDRKALDYITRNVSILSVGNKEVHISLSPLTVEWFILQKTDYTIVERTESKGIVTAPDINKALDWDMYPTYTQYDSIMQSFAALYPTLCRLDTIGTSINGKLVLALKLSDNASVEEEEPEVFYSSTIHGDETGGFVLMLHLADYLLKNYNQDSRVKNIMDNLQIWINPLANPDGTYNTGNTIVSPTRSNANGYDLNRNFPDPFTPNTVKQKETIDMIKFMRNHRFVISANFHSGVEVVNYPWDRWYSKYHADDAWFNSISRSYADTAHTYSGPAYMNYLDNGVTRGADWYVVYGGRQDFITWELQGREVTIELDDSYITPSAQLALLWQYNWHSLLGYIENALYGVHGSVHDAVSDEPIPARVFIYGHDKDSSQVYSDTISGTFVRLLEPGLWNLTFSSNGYYDTTLTDIDVVQGLKTEIVVNMIPRLHNIDTTNLEILVLYPNPARNEIRARLPEGILGEVNIMIYNTTGRLLSDYNEVYQGFPLVIDVGYLPSGMYTAVITSSVTKIVFHKKFIIVK